MRILIIEDEVKTANYLSQGLKENGFVVDIGKDGEEGLYLATNYCFDLIILDVMLPKYDGWFPIKTIRHLTPDVRVLFLTARNNLEDKVKGLELGADDYLVKPFAFSELLARVRSLLRRSTKVPTENISIANLQIDLVKRKVIRDSISIDLTPKEFSLLIYLAQHPGEVLSRTLIAEKVWDVNYSSDTNVVDVAIRRLRQKIDFASQKELIHTVRGVGYVLKRVNLSLSKTASITSRLTIFYAISTVALLTAVCFFSYWAMITIVYKGDYTFLSDEMDIVQVIVEKKQHDYAGLKAYAIDIPVALYGSIYRFYIRIIDEKNKVIIATPGSKEIFNHRSISNLSNLLSRETQWLRSATNEDFFLMQSKIPLKNNSSHYMTVQLALNISYQHRLISNYRNSEFLKLIIAILLIGGLCAIFLGYIIARRSMKRLHDIANTTKNITASSLDQRLNIALWPKELSELGIAFNYMLDRIERSFSQLQQFSADLAHEICTPINNLMGQTEIMLSRNHSSEEYKYVLGSNLEELHRVSQIIESILFLARSENTNSPLNKEQLNVRETLMKVCEYYQIIADEKNIRLILNGDAIINANLILFKRVISNILSNALNYTPPGGKIEFDVRETENESVKISISDTGTGIAHEHLPKIGNRFYRVSADRSSQSGGTGLGLAIVKSIIKLHHGTVSITSELSKGTAVTVTLPK